MAKNPSSGLSHWLKVFGFSLLALVLAYSLISFVAKDGWKDVIQGKLFLSDKQEDTVLARAWVEPQSSMRKGEFRCWISLQNLTKERISDLRFSTVQRFHSERHQPTNASEIEKRVNSDLAKVFIHPTQIGKESTGTSVPYYLEAGDRLTFWTTFLAPESEGEYELLLVYDWVQSGKPSQNSILVGPLDIPSLKDKALRVGNSLYGIGKDLALPVALISLTFLFSQWADRREDARKEAEEQKAQEIKELERHTEQVRETLARMLIISHRDTKKFYLPLLSAAQVMVTIIDKKNRKDWEKEAFYHFFILLRTMKLLKEENGGFYLKSREGEIIISRALRLLKVATEERFDLSTYATAVDEFSTRESYAQFEKTLETKTALKMSWEKFQAWLKGNPKPAFTEYVPLLELFYKTMQYEIDRPLVYWYGKAEEPPRKELEEVMQRLKSGALAKETLEHKLDESVDIYLKEVEIDSQNFNAKMKQATGRVA